MNKEIKHKINGFVQLIAVILFISTAIGISWTLKANKKPLQSIEKEERVIFVEADSFTPAPYRMTFTTTGKVAARANVNIVPEVSGRVINVHEQFYEGGKFNAGEVLFQIEPKDFELEVRRLEAEVARAETTLEVEEAESAAAAAEWRLLNGSKAVPKLVSRKPQLDEAKANLKAAQAQLENAKLDLERTKFILPFDGRVLSSSINIGQYVSQNQNYGEVFDLKALEVQASLEDSQLEILYGTQNPDIDVAIKHHGQIYNYKGALKRGASTVNNQTRFAQLNFGLIGDVSKLLPGNFADITIQAAEINDVSVLPSSALQKDGSLWEVDVASELSRIQNPEIIFNDGAFIAVKGLDASMTVITAKIPGAVEGAKVSVKEPKSGE